MLQGGRT